MAGGITIDNGNNANIAINDYLKGNSNLNLKNQFDDIFSMLMSNKDNNNVKPNKDKEALSHEQKSFSKFDSDFRTNKKTDNRNGKDKVEDLTNEDEEDKQLTQNNELLLSDNELLPVSYESRQINENGINTQDLTAEQSYDVIKTKSNGIKFLNAQATKQDTNIFANLNSNTDIDFDASQLNNLLNQDTQQLSLDDMANDLNIKTVSYKTLENVKTDDASSKTADSLLNGMENVADEQNSYITKLKEDYLNKLNENSQKPTMEQVNLTNKLNSFVDNAMNAALASLQNVVKNSKFGNSYDLDMNYNVEQALVSTTAKSSLFGNQQDIFVSSANSSILSNNTFTNLNSFATAKASTNTNSLLLSQDAQTNAQEIAHKVMQMASKNLKVMELDLDPNNLGKMKIAFNLNDNNEAVSVAIAAASPITKDLLEQSAPRLREILQANNIVLDNNIYALDSSFDANGGFNFDQNSGQNQEQKPFSDKQVLFADLNETEEELAQANTATHNYINLDDNSVSYFA